MNDLGVGTGQPQQDIHLTEDVVYLLGTIECHPGHAEGEEEVIEDRK